MYKRCTKPPKYTLDIANLALDLMKPAVYLHLAIAAWVFGSDTVLHAHPVSSLGEVDSISGETESFGFNTAILNWNGFPPFICLIVLVALDIIDSILTILKIKAVILAVLRSVLFIICFPFRRCCQTGQIEPEIEVPPYFEAMKSGNHFESYLVSHQTMYKNAYEIGVGLQKDTPLYIKQKKFKPQNGIV